MTAIESAPVRYAFTQTQCYVKGLTDSYSETAGPQQLYALHPETNETVRIDPNQAWFWTAEWQAGEREADADLAAGRYEDFGSLEEFLAAL